MIVLTELHIQCNFCLQFHHRPIFMYHLTHIIGNICFRFNFHFSCRTSCAVNFRILNIELHLMHILSGFKIWCGFFSLRSANCLNKLFSQMIFIYIFFSVVFFRHIFPYSYLNGAISAYINEMFVCDRNGPFEKTYIIL